MTTLTITCASCGRELVTALRGAAAFCSLCRRRTSTMPTTRPEPAPPLPRALLPVLRDRAYLATLLRLVAALDGAVRSGDEIVLRHQLTLLVRCWWARP